MTTPSDNLYKTFKLVGFNHTETIIYLTVLELGPSSIWDIAQKSGIKRPTCYAVLDDMVLDGYATKTDDGRRLLYSVASPKELLERLEQKKSEFASSMALIEGAVSQSTKKPKIRLYEGIEGVKQVYMSELMYRDTELLIYGTNEILLTMADFFDYFIAKRVSQNIKARLILARTENNVASTVKDKEFLRETRFFPPEKFNPLEDVNILGDMIIHIAHSEKHPFASVIESASFARHEREKFNLLWQFADPG